MTTVTLGEGPTLSIAEYGEQAGPALVLVPGPTDSWRSYLPILERMPPSIRTIAVSQRGHGDSDKPAGGYRIVDLAADLVRLLDVLDIERAVLAGHSGSSLVVRRVAIDSPNRVAGLVLEASPTTLRGHPGLRAFVTSVVSRLDDPIDPGVIRSFVRDTASAGVDPALIEMAVTEVAKVPARVWRKLFADLLLYDDTSELARITAPTLLIWGDQDTLIGPSIRARLASLLPHDEVAVYPGAGHTPRWDDPGRFATDISALVERSTCARP